MTHNIEALFDCYHCLQVNYVCTVLTLCGPKAIDPALPSAFARWRHKLLQTSVKGKPLNTLSQARRGLVRLHYNGLMIMCGYSRRPPKLSYRFNHKSFLVISFVN